MSGQALGAAHSTWNMAGKLRQPCSGHRAPSGADVGGRRCQRALLGLLCSAQHPGLSCPSPVPGFSAAGWAGPTSVVSLSPHSLLAPKPMKGPLAGPPGVSFSRDPDRQLVVQTLGAQALWRCTEPPSTVGISWARRKDKYLQQDRVLPGLSTALRDRSSSQGPGPLCVTSVSVRMLVASMGSYFFPSWTRTYLINIQCLLID